MGKLQDKEGKYTLEKAIIIIIIINSSTNLKEDSYKSRIPTLRTKLTGSKNYFSLLSFNINGFNS